MVLVLFGGVDGIDDRTFVALPGAPREALEEGVVVAILLVAGECLYVGLMEELGEDVGVCC